MNIWKAFQQLIPGNPLLVGEVMNHNADGTSTVRLPDGALIRARGQAVAAGGLAFVRGGLVEGEAPGLVQIEIEI